MKLEPITMSGNPNIRKEFKGAISLISVGFYDKPFYLVAWGGGTLACENYDDYSQKIIEGRAREKHETQPW